MNTNASNWRYIVDNINREITFVFSCLSRYSSFFKMMESENKKILNTLNALSNADAYKINSTVQKFRKDADKKLALILIDKDEFIKDIILLRENKESIQIYAYKLERYKKIFDTLQKNYQRLDDLSSIKEELAERKGNVVLELAYKRVGVPIGREKDIIESICSRLNSLVNF